MPYHEELPKIMDAIRQQLGKAAVLDFEEKLRAKLKSWGYAVFSTAGSGNSEAGSRRPRLGIDQAPQTSYGPGQVGTLFWRKLHNSFTKTSM